MKDPALLNGFIPPHELAGKAADTPVLLAFSGGPDSSALLSMLVESCKRFNAPLFAAHVDHMIRDNEHERDLSFCIDTAKKLYVPLFILKEDVPRVSVETGESLELAARRIRYEFFAKLMKEHGIPILVTAHNADDNLETVLLNLTRGCGLDGLCGIPPCRPIPGADGVVVRPILGMTKADILAYCRDRSIDFVTDSTNANDDCSRNSIRLHAVPVLREICPSVAHNVYRTCCTVREDREYLSNIADKAFPSGSDALPLPELNSLPLPIRKRVLKGFFDSDLEATHINALVKLAEQGVPHSGISLPGGICAKVENGALSFQRALAAAEAEPYCIPLRRGNNPLPGNRTLHVSDSEINIYNSLTSANIPINIIKGDMFARSRRPGDRIKLGNMHKSVKKLMCDKKIPLSDRDTYPIVCDGDGILYIPGIGVRDGSAARNGKIICISLITG